MPYKANNGSEVPDCVHCCFPKMVDTKMIFEKSGRYIHGDTAKMCCCCPVIECCKVDCSPLAAMCKPAQAACKPVCALLDSWEKFCQGKCSALWGQGPEIPCKAAGCELTCGLAALENVVGVWHLATDSFPSPIPSIVFPCICFGPCPPGLGQDESMSGDKFEKAGGPKETKKVKILDFLCGHCQYGPLCMPHTMVKQSWCGLCMDPLWGGGEAPCWYCNETKCLSVSLPNGAKIGA